MTAPPPPPPHTSPPPPPAQSVSPADVAKYVVEQFKAEIEHTRSWPTKIMAFYVAICLGVVAALVTLGGRSTNPVQLCVTEKWVAIGLIVAVAFATLCMLVRNHWNYCKYRDIQVEFQTQHLQANYKDLYKLPEEWFNKPKRRLWGVGYYVVLVIAIAVLCCFGIWKA